MRVAREIPALAIVASLAVLAGVAIAVAARATVSLDLVTTIALQSVASYPLDLLANANTLVGQAVVTAALGAALALVAWRRDAPWAWLAVGLLALPAFGALALKLALVHPSPPHEFIRAWGNPLGVRVETAGGFPSGHIARVTFLAILAAGLFPSALARVALGLLVAYTFWARIYIGDHWLSDALGGLALGIASGCLALGWLALARRRARRQAILAIT